MIVRRVRAVQSVFRKKARTLRRRCRTGGGVKELLLAGLGGFETREFHWYRLHRMGIGEVIRSYFTVGDFAQFLAARNDPNAHHVLRDKLQTHDWLERHGLAHGRPAFTLEGGPPRRWPSGEPGEPGAGEWVFKPARGAGGLGIFLGAWNDDARTRIGRDRYFLQPRLRNHPDLAGFSRLGLNTLRGVTWRGTVVAAVLKMAVGDEVCDNFSLGRNLAAPVDLKTGRIGLGRFREPYDGLDLTHHPTTGVRFEGCTIPQWDGVRVLMSAAHRSFGGLVSSAWDVAVTPDGPLIVEGHAAYGVWILQCVLDVGFRRVLQAAEAATTSTSDRPSSGANGAPIPGRLLSRPRSMP